MLNKSPAGVRGGSIRRTGIYDAVIAVLQEIGMPCLELANVDPNPRMDSVREGVRICREHKLDVVLAVGGGSVIDCSKIIAAGTLFDDDPWELVKDARKIQAALPVVTVLTNSATGSEMNGGAVIANPASDLHQIRSGRLQSSGKLRSPC